MKNPGTFRHWSLLIVAAVTLLGLTIFTISIYRDQKPASQQQVSQLQQGETIYQRHCAACHGADLKGQPDWKTRMANGRLPAPPHDETGHTWHHDDKLLFELTKYGMVPPNIPEGYESDMPAFKDILSDDEITMALNYIKSRWPEEIRKLQDDMNSQEKRFGKP